jgi:hypothetical protein
VPLIQAFGGIRERGDCKIPASSSLHVELQRLCQDRYRKIVLELANEAVAIRCFERCQGTLSWSERSRALCCAECARYGGSTVAMGQTCGSAVQYQRQQ